MAFADRTPESMVGRCDSKNPATTCRGITSSGRPCRRSLASPKSSPTALRHKPFTGVDGVVPVLRINAGEVAGAAFHCWQHKDQADRLAQQAAPMPRRTHATLVEFQPRTSLDSLAARLGIAGAPAIDTRHAQQLSRIPSPCDPGNHRPSVPRSRNHAFDARVPLHQSRPAHQAAPHRQPKQKKQSFWSALCCMRQPSEDDDYGEIVWHEKRTQEDKIPEMTMALPPSHAHGNTSKPVRRPIASQELSPVVDRASTSRTLVPAAGAPRRKPLSELPIRPANQHVPSSESQTQSLLSFIPPTLSPQTTSILLSELSKPISPYDEAGYIYIFWLTDGSTIPDHINAASLLSSSTPTRSRRPSDIMSAYSRSVPDTPRPANQTIKLKIGRANNVHRRMNEWTRQCGHSLSLVRWYPYVPSSSSSSTHPSPAATPSRSSPAAYRGLYPDLHSQLDAEHMSPEQVRKVPHAHRVERLIHLELADKRVKRDCKQCGKEHREWFEIEATEAGVKGVDEVVRRWVGWAERAGRGVM